MKRRFIATSLIAAYLSACGQKTDDSTVYKKQRLSKTDIQVLFSYYTQDGNHSAVTGGIGTEALQVYAPGFTITHQRDSLDAIQFNAGVDVITSASKDRIDFVLSSASRVDSRIYMNLGYSRLLKRSRIRAGINTGFSIESAYLSLPLGISISHVNITRTREISASLQCFFDDLRWGRLGGRSGETLMLIYPDELRYKQWFDIYLRRSFNLSFAFYQVINKRMQLAIFPELVYQRGLLSTPYHRVYFNDNDHTLKVENLPRERWKIPLGIQLNVFTGNNVIIRSYYRFYRDNFGITAHTLQVETPVKISPAFTLSPLARFYTQTAVRYFRPYKQHDIQESFYTSDYDLSHFNSYKLALTARYSLFKPLFGKYSFQDMELRYAFYKRSDQLTAHIISLLLDFNHTRK
ncbi:uncharacterized protein DUF3570 [Chitinophaga niastensis]|uniref:Uncharacterized protein DUF3570 n=1 Tax=Chitinophaga niastensis TaxID=536980 RepID=A0A2P8HDJ1_CHINA|nr:DUF3570 domain-containing protein [Chitinophaga niastensis]PSL44287.1 uncharacterized protein DUF3570 [Chitinophaga niastensis]